MSRLSNMSMIIGMPHVCDPEVVNQVGLKPEAVGLVFVVWSSTMIARGSGIHVSGSIREYQILSYHLGYLAICSEILDRGNVTSPSDGVRVPSAMVGGFFTVCSLPV